MTIMEALMFAQESEFELMYQWSCAQKKVSELELVGRPNQMTFLCLYHQFIYADNAVVVPKPEIRGLRDGFLEARERTWWCETKYFGVSGLVLVEHDVTVFRVFLDPCSHIRHLNWTQFLTHEDALGQ